MKIEMLLYLLYTASAKPSLTANTFFPQYQLSLVRLPKDSANKLLAYADFNSDNFVDMLTLAVDQKQAFLQIYNPSKKSFIATALPRQDEPIQGGLSGDLNRDGMNDILLVVKAGEQFRVKVFYLSIQADQIKVLNQTSLDALLDSPQVLFFDPYGTRMLSVLVNSQGKTVHLSDPDNNGLYSPDKLVFSESLRVQDVGKVGLVDFTGDCLADMIVANKASLQFWQKKSNVYTKVKTLDYNQPIQSISFGDMNFDGSVDIVTAFSRGSLSYFRIHYNDFSDRDQSSFCKPFSSFPFSDSSETNSFEYPLNGTLLDQSLRLGDLNIDGFPDVLAITREKPVVLLNQRCSLCTQLNENTISREEKLRRVFVDANLSLAKNESLKSITIFDLYEDCKLDIVLSTPQGIFIHQLVQNFDAFMLKILPLNGVRTGAPLNGHAVGVSLHWLVTDINGRFIEGQGNQLSKPVVGSLQLPYYFAGLGRTNNYVQNFYAGFGQDTDNVRMWTPIIPNSQLILLPFGSTSGDWQINIYIQPTDKIYTVLLVSVVILGVLGLVIFYLHRKQQQEDNLSKEHFFHLIR